MSTALFVVGLLAFIGVIQAVIWFFVLRSLRRLTTNLADELRGMAVLLGPERVHYQGATGGSFPRTRGFVAVALTPDRFLLRRISIRGFDVRLSEITRVRQQKRWNGRYRNGKAHIAIQTDRGEFAIQPSDADAWMAALGAALPPLG